MKNKKIKLLCFYLLLALGGGIFFAAFFFSIIFSIDNNGFEILSGVPGVNFWGRNI